MYVKCSKVKHNKMRSACMSSYSHLACNVSAEKCADNIIVVYLRFFFSCWFKNSLLVFGFRQFHYNTSGEDYFDESIGWSASFMNLGFQISPSVQEVLIHYLFKLSLSSSLLLPGFWRYTDCFSKGVPYISQIFFILFHSFVFLFFCWKISCGLHLGSWYLPLLGSVCP